MARKRNTVPAPTLYNADGRGNEAEYAKLSHSLLLNHYILHLFGCESFDALTKELKDPRLEGYDDDNTSLFCRELINRLYTCGLSEEELLRYDSNIKRHTDFINRKRALPIKWKYFQYLSLLFVEIYLDHFFSNKELFVQNLNEYLAGHFNDMADTNHSLSPYSADELNKVCLWNATGSGKTLLMHINILQYKEYAERAGKRYNHILLITPNEGLTRQHLAELYESGIDAHVFQKGGGGLFRGKEVEIIEISKLAEQDGDKTVAVGSFEEDNFVLVDEGHKGSSGEVWRDMRERLAVTGFSFEYSATFGQSVSSQSTGDKTKLLNEYGKSTIFDYSYRYFYNDGYGKDYEILNLNDTWTDNTLKLYLTACLLNFYEQIKVFKTEENDMRKYLLEKPLAIFVGSSVTAVRTINKKEESDVVTILNFFKDFVGLPAESIESIRRIMDGSDGLIDKSNNPIFRHSFNYLHRQTLPADSIFTDMLLLLFNSTVAGAQLHLDNLKGADGEIGMRIGNDEYFGVINVGDDTKLLKLCTENHINTAEMEFNGKSLFGSINQTDSPINILIGSKKFTEGWNSWRVSTMGLMNIGRSEGSEIIQLFGRGVRLKGYNYSLKRSSALDPSIRPDNPPKFINLLEKLNIFGIRADYMEQFKAYLKEEGVPTNNSDYEEIELPVLPTVNLSDKKLKYIRVIEGRDFKSEVTVNIVPNNSLSEMFKLRRGEIALDYYPKIQILKSRQNASTSLPDILNEAKLTPEILKWIDWTKVFFAIQRFKNEKSWYNICIPINNLKAIISDNSWYRLLIPADDLAAQDFKYSTSIWQDITTLLLCHYVERLYNKMKGAWMSENIETAYLDESNPNFEAEYKLLIHKDLDNVVSKLKALKQQISDKSFSQTLQIGQNFEALYFSQHLYQPLLYFGGKSENAEGTVVIEIRPVPLNKGERDFIVDMKKYYTENSEFFAEKQLYLLRNRSRKGIGFFEANNFYPDFIVWLVEENKQYIIFVDPKGIKNLAGLNDPKIQLSKVIKKVIEPRLKDSNICLNSFILSNTPIDQVAWWKTDEDTSDTNAAIKVFNNEYVLFQNEQKQDYIQLMLEKVRQ